MSATIRDPKIFGPDYEIEIDYNNISLIRLKTVKEGKMKGKEVREYVGYFSTLDSCISKFVILKVVDAGKIFTLSEYVNQYAAVFQKTIKAINDKYSEELRLLRSKVRSKEND